MSYVGSQGIKRGAEDDDDDGVTASMTLGYPRSDRKRRTTTLWDPRWFEYHWCVVVGIVLPFCQERSGNVGLSITLWTFQPWLTFWGNDLAAFIFKTNPIQWPGHQTTHSAQNDWKKKMFWAIRFFDSSTAQWSSHCLLGFVVVVLPLSVPN